MGAIRTWRESEGREQDAKRLFLEVSHKCEQSLEISTIRKTHKDDPVEALLEPRHRVLLLHLVLEAHACLLLLAACDAETRATHDDVEVHAEDTDVGVVTRTKVDVLLDAEPEVAGLGEVAADELVLLHLEPTLEDLLRFRPANGNVHSDLLVTPDPECAHGVARFGRDRRLSRELFQHFRRTRQAIARLADRDV
jgi:hypothetical protein